MIRTRFTASHCERCSLLLKSQALCTSLIVSPCNCSRSSYGFHSPLSTIGTRSFRPGSDESSDTSRRPGLWFNSHQMVARIVRPSRYRTVAETRDLQSQGLSTMKAEARAVLCNTYAVSVYPSSFIDDHKSPIAHPISLLPHLARNALRPAVTVLVNSVTRDTLR